MSTAVATIAPAKEIAREPDQQELLLELNAKIDRLSQQVGHLYSRTMALEELKDELMVVARDAMAALRVELSDVEHEFNTEEITLLVRKLVRSTPRLIRLLEYLESIDGLVAEVEPLGKEVLRDLVDRLQLWEERGVFRLASGTLAAVDRIAQHSTQEDIDRLVGNVDRIIDTIKRLTQPEMLEMADNAARVLSSSDGHVPQAVGLWGLVRSLGDPEIQKGLGVLLTMLRQVGGSAAQKNKESYSDTKTLRQNDGAKE
jgi:uncharacterized protein YjgD (DUF1641 family)